MLCSQCQLTTLRAVYMLVHHYYYYYYYYYYHYHYHHHHHCSQYNI